jgi:hypothetical protein
MWLGLKADIFRTKRKDTPTAAEASVNGGDIAQTSNQTVMSGAPSPEKPIKSDD